MGWLEWVCPFCERVILKGVVSVGILFEMRRNEHMQEHVDEIEGELKNG